MKNLIIGLITIFALSNVQAFEGTPKGVYFGASYLAKVKSDESSETKDTLRALQLDLDDDDQGYRAFLGYKIHPHLAFELAYSDFGEFTAKGGGVKIKSESDYAISLSAVANTPLVHNRLRFFAKAGLGKVKFDNSISGSELSFEDIDDTTPFIGAGASFSLTDQLSVRAEYEYWDSINESSLDVFAIGLQFQPSFCTTVILLLEELPALPTDMWGQVVRYLAVYIIIYSIQVVI